MDRELTSKKPAFAIYFVIFTLFFSPNVSAFNIQTQILHQDHTLLGLVCLIIFLLAYVLVVLEEKILLRKSKPMILAASIIWILIFYLCHSSGQSELAIQATNKNLVDFAQLFLFLLVAMTYVNALEERNVFIALKSWLLKKNMTYRKCFWLTGILSFFMSSFLDNLTATLILGAFILTIGKENDKFITLSYINVVVAANAGGVFTPFGDVTTLMIWQKGVLPFNSFFHLFIPAVISFIVPAFFMQFAIPKKKIISTLASVEIKVGAKLVATLFAVTLLSVVLLHQYLAFPPTLGMMLGLSYLFILSYILKIIETKKTIFSHSHHTHTPFNIFNKIKNAEWDTLLFFYGIIFCIGGLFLLGHLNVLSTKLYTPWIEILPNAHAFTPANIIIGIISSVIGNIPITYAILTISPHMSQGQWLLVTLSVGIGGSLLSIGSAAGIAAMGQSHGLYTFLKHLKWFWAIVLGYICAIVAHLFLNNPFF